MTSSSPFAAPIAKAATTSVARSGANAGSGSATPNSSAAARVALAGPSRRVSRAANCINSTAPTAKANRDEAERAVGQREARLQRRDAGRPGADADAVGEKDGDDGGPLGPRRRSQRSDAAAHRVASPTRSARRTRTPARRSGANALSGASASTTRWVRRETGATAKGAAVPSLSVVTAAATALAPSAMSRLNSASSASKAARPARVDGAGAEKGEIDADVARVAQRPRPERRAGARIDPPADDDQFDAGPADEIGGDVGRVGRDDEVEAGGKRARNRGVGRAGVEEHDLARAHQRRGGAAERGLALRRFGRRSANGPEAGDSGSAPP